MGWVVLGLFCCVVLVGWCAFCRGPDLEQLMAMVPGIDRDAVIQAFIACDKNAEMAASLLLD